MQESDREAGKAIESAERARGMLMGGNTAAAAEELRQAIESSASALRTLGYTVVIEVTKP